MAEVWLAHDARLDVRRAIKILDPNLQRNPKIRARFDAEARAMARLVHPHVVTVHDVAEDGDHNFIVMELVHGGSLAEKVRTRGPLPPRIACELLAAVLDALDAAHALSIIHRDVKPHNVLLTADGVPKLTDFGIAQLDAGKLSMTRTGSVMGTIPYMAPEQKQDAKSVGPAADVYGIGATLYHVVTGAEPYDLYVESVRKQVLQGLYTEVAEIIDRATQYEPKDRYRTASEMRGALLGCIPRLPYPPVGLTAWMGNPNTAIAAPSMGEDFSDGHTEAPKGHTETVNFESAPPQSVKVTPRMGAARTELRPEVPAPAPAAVDTVLRPERAPDVETVLRPVPEAPRAVPTSSSLPSAAGPGAAAPGLALGLTLAAAALVLALVVVVGAVAYWQRGDDPAVATVPEPVAAPLIAPAPAPVAPAPVTPDPAAPVPTATNPAPTPDPAPVKPAPRPTPSPEPAPQPVVQPPAPEPVSPPPVAPAPSPDPAPAPAPAAPTGILVINSRPPGATVTVDGDPHGATPARLELAPGPHTVRLEASGTIKAIKQSVSQGVTTSLCWDFESVAPCKR